MTELQGLIETDRLATLSINGSESLFWDGVANIYTSAIERIFAVYPQFHELLSRTRIFLYTGTDHWLHTEQRANPPGIGTLILSCPQAILSL